MKNRGKNLGGRGWRRPSPLLLLVGLAMAPTARAGLGEPRASVRADHLALGGTALAVRTGPGYEVHETTTAQGGTIRQYVGAAGTVFAVSWNARFQPNLQQLLATHYAEYLAAARARRGSHHLLSLSGPGLVLSIVQLPRGSAGAAHLPALVPAGVRPEQLR
jgi:hypothetical protein